jgi:hypothetical protein
MARIRCARISSEEVIPDIMLLARCLPTVLISTHLRQSFEIFKMMRMTTIRVLVLNFRYVIKFSD